MTHSIAEIKGLDPTAQKKLEQAQITTTDHLLRETAAPPRRAALAKQIGVSDAQLTEWINRADLMRLQGVGTEMANLLEECGVDSCKEMQHRNPDHLYANLRDVNDTRKITHRLPALQQVETWVREAATLAKQ